MHHRDLAGCKAHSHSARRVQPRVRLLASAIATGLLALSFAAARPAQAAGTCTWDGTNNNWNSSGDWTGCNGTFPGIGASTGYDVLVGSGTSNITTGGINAGALTIGVNGVSNGTVRASDSSASAQFGSVNVVWGQFDVINGASISTTGDLTNSNNGTVTVDQAGGQGGSTLNVGGAINNSNGFYIGNSTLSAATNVTASSITANNTLNITGSATNQASLKIAGAAGFGTAGVLTGNVTLQGDALLQFGSGGITSIANGANLDLNGANAQMNIVGGSGPNSALTGLAVNNYSFNLENGASLTTTTSFTNNNTVNIDARGGDGGSTFNVGGTLSTGMGNSINIGNSNLSANTSVTAQSLSMAATIPNWANGGSLSITGSATNQASLKIAGAAGFGTAGELQSYLSMSGDSLLQFGSGGITNIASGGLYLSGANAQVQIAGNGGNNSALTGLNAVTAYGYLQLQDGATLTTTGDLTIGGGSYINVNTDNNGGSSLTVGGTITNNNQLNIGNGWGISAPASVTAQAIDNPYNSTINVASGSSNQAALIIAGPAGFGTAGVVSGNVNVGSVAVWTGNSLVQFGSGALTSIAGGAQLVLDGPNAQVQIAGNSANNSALTGLASSAGLLQLDGGASLTTTTGYNNSGFLEVGRHGTGATFNIGGVLTNDCCRNSTGVVVGGNNTGPANLTATGLVNAGYGDVELYGNSSTSMGTMTINGAANNSAWVGVNAYGNLVVTGANAYTQTGGATTVYANGTLTAPTVAINGGTLEGFGTVIGNVVTNTGGTISGGHQFICCGMLPVGTLTVQGNLVNTASGTVAAYMNGNGNTAITIASGSPILQGGTIQGAAVNNFAYAAGQTFTVMNYAPGSLSGMFSAVQNGANAATPGTYTNLGGGLTMGVVYNDHAGNIQLVVVNTPATTTETWNGGTGNWNTGSGWSSAAAPQFYSDVTIGATGSGNVTLNQDATISSLAINNGNTLAYGATPATLAVGGNVTIAAGGTLSLPTSGDKLDLGGNFNNAGATTLAGASIQALGTVSNSGTLSGNGTVNPAIANTGLVEASGGTLIAVNGVQGASGNITIDSGSTLDLSQSTTASTVGTLAQNGALNLGSQNLTVSTDYNNANFGGGNSFNKTAGVTGAGQILATGNVTQAISGPDVTGGNTANATLAFGNVHVGTATNANYAIGNAGTVGPSLRGAIQTSVNGGNLTDASLSGNGVTAGNWGPVAAGGQSSVYTVTYAPTQAGALSGQAVHIANNFANVGEQTMTITGAAYAYADPTVTSSLGSPFNFGVVQVGQTYTDALTIKNVLTAANAAYQEGLNASFGTFGNPELTGNGSITNLAAGQSNAGGMVVTFKPVNTGTVSGTVQVNLASNGAGTSGLGITNLASQNLNYGWQFTGTVINQANPSITPNPVSFAARVGDSVSQALTVQNVAGAPPQASLDAQVAGTTGAASMVSSMAINQLAAGQSNNTNFVVGLNTATAGAQSGTVNIALQSDSTPNGCTSNCIVNLSNATVNVSGNVYTPAQATVNTAGPVNFGIVHVGDGGGTLSRSLSVTNSAAVTALNDTLLGSVSASGAPFTGTGSLTAAGLAAQQSSSALGVNLSTATAGLYSGTANLAFASHDSQLTDLALAGATVGLKAQVNNYAGLGFTFGSGLGTLTLTAPNTWTLDLGNIAQNSHGGLASTLLSFVNTGGPAAFTDMLTSAASVTSGSGFTLSGDTVANLVGNASQAGFGIGLGTSSTGFFNELLSFNIGSSNASGYSQNIGMVTIDLKGSVVSGVVGVPEPRGLEMFLAGLAMLGVLSRLGFRRTGNSEEA